MEKASTYLKRACYYIKNGNPVIEKIVNVGVVNYHGCLKGRKILITGGGKGLGYAIAVKCLSEGADVVITGRNSDTLEKAVRLLGGKNVSSLSSDVRDADKATELIRNVADLMGGLDSVVSNAGISLHEKSWDSVSFDQWDQQMEINLRGSYFIAQAFFNYLDKQDPVAGSLIIMASERGLYGDDLPYGLGKAALINLSLGLAKKAVGTGIRVNVVAPGVTATDMTGHDPAGNLYRQYARGKRILLPEEIAETTVFLMSAMSICISGAVLTCTETNHLR